MGAPVGVLEPHNDALPPLSLAAAPRDSEGVDDSEGVEVPRAWAWAGVSPPEGDGVGKGAGGGVAVGEGVGAVEGRLRARGRGACARRGAR